MNPALDCRIFLPPTELYISRQRHSSIEYKIIWKNAIHDNASFSYQTWQSIWICRVENIYQICRAYFIKKQTGITVDTLSSILGKNQVYFIMVILINVATPFLFSYFLWTAMFFFADLHLFLKINDAQIKNKF